MSDFDATVQFDGPLPVLRIAGVLDRDVDASLIAAFESAVVDAPDRIVVDVSAMTYMNSSGIANLVVLLREAQTHDVAITVRGLTAHYRHLFEITRIADLVRIEQTTENLVEPVEEATP